MDKVGPTAFFSFFVALKNHLYAQSRLSPALELTPPALPNENDRSPERARDPLAWTWHACEHFTSVLCALRRLFLLSLTQSANITVLNSQCFASTSSHSSVTCAHFFLNTLFRCSSYLLYYMYNCMPQYGDCDNFALLITAALSKSNVHVFLILYTVCVFRLFRAIFSIYSKLVFLHYCDLVCLIVHFDKIYCSLNALSSI